jgi:HSP20 family protein
MSLLFPRFQEFSPLFRLADEFDRATRSAENKRSFAPRFDVNETRETYELHGELPGIEQRNVNIEWADDNTLTISGETERRYESTNATEAEEVTPDSTSEDPHAYHKPTVEDDTAEASTNDAAQPNTAVTKASDKNEVAKHSDQPRYWVTERSFGSFNRTFQFPSRVDHEGVKASMKNGVLTITVPKAKARAPRKIEIN